MSTIETIGDSLERTRKGLWAGTPATVISDRVREAIENDDETSEVLLKLIQLVVFAFWGIVYFLTPQPDPTTTSQVPIIISVYLIFTFGLLIMTLARRMPTWLIYVSIAVDMGLLTYLIWSFHVQYDQPASFSLKVVEVMNYFVLIGLRALRFQARYVLAAGLFATMCWSAMVLYAVLQDPADPMITRDYVTYITSNSVLVGAEISKLISIIMFTAILAVAVKRAQNFFVSSVAEEYAASDLSRFLDGSVAKQIRGADHKIQAGEGVRRNAAILSVDIRGFSQLVAPLPPQEAMRLLSDYQHYIVPIVQRHGGTVDKYMGDGVLITFGAAMDDPEYCANALRCADDILSEQASWPGPANKLDINLAISAGPVVYGAVGDGDRLEVTVIGSRVNRAAKLEKHNKVLGTRGLASENSFNTAVAQGYRNPVERRKVATILANDTEKTNIVILA